MSSDNKESLNDMINRLTAENEQLKQTSVELFIKAMKAVELIADNANEKTYPSYAIRMAEKFLSVAVDS